MIAETTQLEDFLSGAPGMYIDIPFTDYLHAPVMSQSTLKEGRKSMLHLKSALDGERFKKVTDDMMLGSALHVCFLEPEQMPERVILWEGGARRGKDWEAFSAEHADKIILTEGYHEKLVGMVKALRSKAAVRGWMSKVQSVEVSAIGDVHGLAFKCRADALTDDPLWDLKKIVSVDDRTINSTIVNFGYHIQAYVYKQVFKRDRFCLGFVEGTKPHDVRVVELSDNWLKLGREETLSLIQAYQHCVKEGRWPGRSEVIEKIEPPSYLLEQGATGVAITMDGEEIL